MVPEKALLADYRRTGVFKIDPHSFYMARQPFYSRWKSVSVPKGMPWQDDISMVTMRSWYIFFVILTR